ncbi:metal-binding hypothetical protein [Caballeronia hypogeia]|uniref:Metal-binding integral membrane protein n=1 Tax=Caballeronia hypogeia TaxID=1777140 RepID=A0A158A342_9BURK|nr:DUF2182 domain-containing protein [Caballeronia hypogeia]SAK52242.1 metal-binding hypothetical protein [Caballeronia hypogeia]
MNALTVTPLSRERFFIVAVIVFIASVLATCALHASMTSTTSMTGLSMPGGWTLSTTFSPMCGRTWLRAAASFLGMWIAMMTAMMLPSFAPFLWRYRMQAPGAALMTAGYAFIWTTIGIAIFVLGALFTELMLRAPAIARCVPVASGTLVLLAGAWQCSTWHARLLACCRHAKAQRNAWLDGVHHGLHCALCCMAPTIALIVFGMMDLPAMALVTLAISAERLTRSQRPVTTRAIGVVLIALGIVRLVA